MSRQFITPYAEVDYLRKEVERLTERSNKLEFAATQGAKWFNDYATRHVEKGDTLKAARNFERAAFLLDTIEGLNRNQPDPLGAIQEIVKLFEHMKTTIMWGEVEKVLKEYKVELK